MSALGLRKSFQKLVAAAAFGAALFLGGQGIALAAPASCTSACFVLTGLQIDGVTAYPLAEFAPLYEDRLAREVGSDDLVAIAQRITDKYRADGYFLSRAAVTRMPDGAGPASIQVYEGYITKVAFAGDTSPAVERALGQIAGHKPLRLSELEQGLAQASDIPGVRIRSQLEPVLEDPAQHVMRITSEIQRVSSSLYIDNRGTRGSGPWQAFASASVNSAITAGDQISAGLLVTPQDLGEFTYAEMSYSRPMPNGARLRVMASASKAEDGQAADRFGNRSQAASVRYQLPLVQGRDRSTSVSVSLDARRQEQDWIGGGAVDELRVVRAGVQTNLPLAGGQAAAAVQVSQGLDILGATDSAGPGHTRYGADSQFTKVNAQASYYHDIGSKAGIYASAEGQWSDDSLLASEEFGVGALPYGRAYNYSELMGDKGVAGQLELRVGWDPNVGSISFFQLYGFVDAAKVWNNDWPSGNQSAALSSAGGGLRLNFDNKLSLRLEAAKPLSRAPYETRDKDWRGTASLSFAF